MLRTRWIVILACILMGCGEDVITGVPCDDAIEVQRCAGDGMPQVCNRETSEWENKVTCAESEVCQMVEGVASCVPQTPACTTASDCSEGCCGTDGTCHPDTDGDGVCDPEDACPDANDALLTETCECADKRFAGPDCTTCADAKFTGDACDVCADPKFTGSACDECADAKFTGPDCTTCADAKFTGADCDVCADPKFTGAACDVCADSKFTGAACDTCADPKFTGVNCDQCVDDKFTGDACDQCADAKFKGPNCDECADSKYTGPDCNACADPKAVGPDCEKSGFGATVSVVTNLAIGGVEDTPECCFDLDGDGEIDNALGNVLDNIGGLLGDGDVNGELAEEISSGNTILLFEYAGLENPQAAGDFNVNLLYGKDTDDDYTANAAGTGSFLVDSDSFEPGTMIPQAMLGSGKLSDDGAMSAGPGNFELSFPVGTIKLDVKVSGALLEASTEVGPNGLGLAFTGGMLGGAIKMADLFNAFNAFVDIECGCLGLEGAPLITYIPELAQGMCTKPTNASCEDSGTEDACAQVADYCSILLLFLKPDLDTDFDGKNDAMSVGVWVDATSATIEGVAP